MQETGIIYAFLLLYLVNLGQWMPSSLCESEITRRRTLAPLGSVTLDGREVGLQTVAAGPRVDNG